MYQALHEFINGDRIPMPNNADQAKLMDLISLNRLEINASEHLRHITVDTAVIELHRDFVSRIQSGRPLVPLDQKQINAFKQAIYGLFASQLGHPKIDIDVSGKLNATTVAKEAIQPGQSLGSAQGN